MGTQVWSGPADSTGYQASLPSLLGEKQDYVSSVGETLFNIAGFSSADI